MRGRTRVRLIGVWGALGLTLLLGGCLEQPPVLLSSPGGGYAATPGASVREFTAAGRAEVRPGDTIYSFARRHEVPLRAVIDLNHLAPPYLLKSGQELQLPAVVLHTVKHGETLYGLSHDYGVDLYAVAQANGLEPPYVIRTGQRLVIPKVQTSPATAAAVRMAAAPPPSPPSPRAISAARLSPPPGPSSLSGVPRPPGASSQLDVPRPPGAAAAPEPEARPAGGVSAGGAAPPPTAPTRTAAPRTAAPQTEPAVATALAAVPEPRAEPAIPPQDHEVASLPPATRPAPAADEASAPGTFLWPVSGPIISHFGAKQGGLHNDGINIAVPRGTPVRAAQAGVVVYAGNELRGYGNLLLLRHADGYLTAYAHNEKLLVHRGDKVTRGEVIARSGESGGVSSPQLHFEIRHGTRPVNPLKLLPHLTAGGTGDTSGS